MKQKIRRLVTLVLSFVMLLSLISPAVGMLVNAAEQTEGQTADLRVGILSDVHLGYHWDKEVQTPRFQKALTVFKDMGVDAIVISGDLQDVDGEGTMDEQKAWMEEFAEVWFTVFPADSGVEPVFIYGNHDVDLIAAKYWPESLGKYTDAFIKEIKGYQFVGVNNGKEDLAIVDEYIAQAAAASEGKPFFYVQHCPLYQSVVQSDYYSAYSQSFRGAGHQNLKNYANAVAFHGHTHVPLTDERSIWQGDDWSDGKYTAINASTLNYAGTYARVSDTNTATMDVNGKEIAHTQTQQGMYMTVSGSQVSIDRYSFYEDTPVKIGATWSFDACDENDRPYTYDGRYAAATAPEFAQGAEITVDNVTDNAVTVSFPAASLATDGNGDMIQSYLAEVVDPVTGKVVASNGVLTEYHIDNSSRFADNYIICVTGLEQGRTYEVNVYAREFFQKKSAPLSVTVTTTGTAQPGQAGDVNGDGAVNADDMTLLQAICAGTAENTQWSDVDGNYITETADLAALENLLAGNKAVSEDPAVDVLGASTYTVNQSFSGSNWNVALQSAVTREGKGVALKVASTTAAGWPFVEVLFDEPQDWSDKNVLEFDTLFDTDSSWIAVTLISGEDLVLGNVGAAYQTAMDQPFQWAKNVKTIKLSDFTNVDFTAVRGIRFAYNLAEYEGRFDGVKEHAVYIDNVKAAYIPGVAADLDLLGTAQIAGGEKVYAVGQTKGSNEAVKSETGSLTVTLNDSYNFSRYASLQLDAKLVSAGNVTVQALDADGNALGQSVTLSAGSKWSSYNVAVREFAADGLVSQLRFSFSGTLQLDNMSLEALKDTDLIGTSTITYKDHAGLNYGLQNDVTNNSNSALGAIVTDAGYNRYPKATLNLSGAVDPATTHFTVDVERTYSDWYFRVEFLDGAGAVLGNHLIGTSDKGWQTHTFMLSALSVDSVIAEELSRITQVRFTMSMDENIPVGEGMYIDNASFIARDTDLIGTAAITYKDANGHSIGVQNVVTNNSLDALKVEITDASSYGKWPKITLNMGKTLDSSVNYFTIDDEQTNCTGSLNIEFLDSNSAQIGKKTIYGSHADTGWRTHEIELAEVVGADQIEKIQMVRITLYPKEGLAAGSAIYLDNIRFETRPVDKDLLAKATYDSGNFSGTTYKQDLNSNVVSSEDSLRSLKLSCIETAEGWPVGKFKLKESIDLTDKALRFDVKFENASRWIGVILYDSEGNQLTSSYGYDAKSDGWETVVMDFSSKLQNGKDLTDVAYIRFGANFYQNVGVERAVYFDNLEMVVGNAVEAENDLLASMSFVKTSAGYSYQLSSGEVYGENSNRSLAYSAAANQDGWPYTYFAFDEAQDLTGATLEFDIKFVNARQWTRVRFCNSASKEIAKKDFFSSNKDGVWQHVSMDLTGLTVSEISQLAFGFDFNTNNTLDRVVYIDNVQIIYPADSAASGVETAAVYNTDNYKLTDTVTGASTLSFNSAKGEVESAQLVVKPTKAISAYSVSVTNAVSASGKVIPASAFEVYAAKYIEVTGAVNGGENGFFRMP